MSSDTVPVQGSVRNPLLPNPGCESLVFCRKKGPWIPRQRNTFLPHPGADDRPLGLRVTFRLKSCSLWLPSTSLLPVSCQTQVPSHFIPFTVPSSPLRQLVAASWDGYSGVSALARPPVSSAATPTSPSSQRSLNCLGQSLIEADSLPLPNLDHPHLPSPPGPNPPFFSPIQSQSQDVCCHSPFTSRAPNP